MYGEMLELIGRDDWEGDDCSVTCPDGCRVEPDAPTCPCGEVNPLTAAGMI